MNQFNGTFFTILSGNCNKVISFVKDNSVSDYFN